MSSQVAYGPNWNDVYSFLNKVLWFIKTTQGQTVWPCQMKQSKEWADGKWHGVGAWHRDTVTNVSWHFIGVSAVDSCIWSQFCLHFTEVENRKYISPWSNINIDRRAQRVHLATNAMAYDAPETSPITMGNIESSFRRRKTVKVQQTHTHAIGI